MEEYADRSYQVYALIDPRDELVHYVGISTNVKARLRYYLGGGYANIQQKHWFLELIQNNLSPILRMLETIEASGNSYNIACEREYYWIEELFHLGNPLLNNVGIKRVYYPSPIKNETSKSDIRRKSVKAQTKPSVPSEHGPKRRGRPVTSYPTKRVKSNDEKLSQQHIPHVLPDSLTTSSPIMSQSQDEPMLTVKQVARRMNVDEATVRRWIQAGRLRAVNIGHLRAEYRIRPSDLNDFISNGETDRTDN